MTDMTRSGALRTDRALLVLEDGTVYRGYGYGATGASLGEAVFSIHVFTCSYVLNLVVMVEFVCHF